MKAQGLDVKSEVPCNLNVDGEVIEDAYRLDLLINDCLIIELKSVQKIRPEHHKQLITYLKLTNKPYGLLVNFNCDNLFQDGLRSWKTKDLK